MNQSNRKDYPYDVEKQKLDMAATKKNAQGTTSSNKQEKQLGASTKSYTAGEGVPMMEEGKKKVDRAAKTNRNQY